MKVLIFDSGTLINLSMNGLLYLLENLKQAFPGIKFIITNQVKYETLDRPIKVQRFELEALEIKYLIEKKVIELPESINIQSEEIKTGTEKLMTIANSLLQLNRQPIKIISDAEASCMALSEILNRKRIENLIAIDERTTRTLAENPLSLEKIISNKIHQPVRLSAKNFQEFKQFRFIRSTELVFVAFKKNLTPIKDPHILEAMIYATKFKGSAISWDEIKVLKKL